MDKYYSVSEQNKCYIEHIELNTCMNVKFP